MSNEPTPTPNCCGIDPTDTVDLPALALAALACGCGCGCGHGCARPRAGDGCGRDARRARRC